MADVSQRGQLILVAGFALAVTFVTLAVLLNTAIFAENLATRQTGGHVTKATAAAGAVTGGLQEAIYHVDVPNADNESRDVLREDLETLSSDWSHHAARQLGVDGSTIQVEVTGTTNGTRIVHANGTRAWTAAGGAGNWTLYESVDAADHRWFVLNVSRSNLTTMSLDDNMTTVLNDSFTVEITSETRDETWRLHLFEATGTGNVYVLVETPSGVIRGADGTYADHVAAGCVARDEQVTVQVWEGTVEHTPCESLDFTRELTGPITTRFENATSPTGTARVKGTYDVLLATSSLDRGPYHDATTTDDSPYTVWAITRTTVDLTYMGGDITQTTTETVRANWVGGLAVGGRPVGRFGVNDSSASSSDAVHYAVNWQARDRAGDLEWVNVTVEDDTGTVVGEFTHAVSGEFASGVDVYTCASGGSCGSSHTITVAVRDTDGHLVTETQDHDPDGDNGEVTAS